MNWIVLLKVNFYLLIFLILLFCKNDYPVLKEESREKLANLRFSNFKRIQYKGIGLKKWELRSEESYIYNNNDNQIEKIIVYNFIFEQFIPNKVTFKSNKAILDYKSNKMYLEGNAEYYDKEITIYSNSLIYDMEKDILDTKVPVKIKRKNIETDCLKGLYYSKKEEIQICRNPAGKIFQEKLKQNNQNEQNNFFF